MGLALLSSPPAPEAKSPAPASAESVLAEALLQWRSGNLIQAELLCAQVRAQRPDHLHALMLAAAMRSSAGDLDAAAALLSRAVALAPGHPMASHFMAQLLQRRGDDAKAVELFEAAAKGQPNYAPTQNDLGVSLQRLGRHSAAIAAFDRAIALDPGFATAHCNRGLVLLAMGGASDAAQSFRTVLGLTPNSAATWLTLGLAHQTMSEFEAAEAAFRKALALDPACEDARLNLAHALYRGHRREEAASHFAEWSRRQGIKVKPCLAERPVARMLLIGGTGPHNTPTHFLFGPRHFETITLYLPPEGTPEGDLALLAACPEFDLVFNAVGDPDCGASYLKRIGELARHVDVPVLNPPERVALTRRDVVAARLGDVAGTVVPGTRRLARAALAEIAASRPWDAALLIRPAGAHGGEDLRRIDEPAAIAPYLAEMPFDEFYLTEFCDYRSADGYFRKYRLIFVDREIYPYHLAICEDWLAHYWRADMRKHAWMRQEEAAFLADYTAVFRGEAAAALQEIARRLDLDYAGIDCSLTRDGRLVLFEANASMLVQLGEPIEDYPYKHAYVPRIADAMRRMVARRRA